MVPSSVRNGSFTVIFAYQCGHGLRTLPPENKLYSYEDAIAHAKSSLAEHYGFATWDEFVRMADPVIDDDIHNLDDPIRDIMVFEVHGKWNNESGLAMVQMIHEDCIRIKNGKLNCNVKEHNI